MSNENQKLPHIARYKPYYFKVVKGKTYHWCACGLSAKQPFCDGSHKGTGYEPMPYAAAADEEVLFCGCKQTQESPFCDGRHNNLRDTYEGDDPDGEANRNIPTTVHHTDGQFALNGRCFVTRPDLAPMQQQGALRWCPLIGRKTGAEHLSQFYFEVAAGNSPVVSFGDRDAILLATQGRGEITISGKAFGLAPEVGLYVRGGETFSVNNALDEAIKLYVSVCPLVDAPDFEQSMNDAFDEDWPSRTVKFDADKRRKMADRTFQLLVDKVIGSELATQFIGDIPRSKAAPHRHLYEEALVVLKGKGCMWTEDMKAVVKTGDIIFFPSKQVHSLECTNDAGMTVAGVIYPGGNPDINF